jgi:CO dehydrogenase maturation factor
VGDEKLDVTIVVIEPTPRSIDVGVRALEHAHSHHQGRILVVANKVRTAKERQMIESAIGEAQVTVVPYSEAVVNADRKGTSVFDEECADDFILPIRELAASLN